MEQNGNKEILVKLAKELGWKDVGWQVGNIMEMKAQRNERGKAGFFEWQKMQKRRGHHEIGEGGMYM